MTYKEDLFKKYGANWDTVGFEKDFLRSSEAKRLKFKEAIRAFVKYVLSRSSDPFPIDHLTLNLFKSMFFKHATLMLTDEQYIEIFDKMIEEITKLTE